MHTSAISEPNHFFERDDLSVIVAKVKAVGPDDYRMDLELPENAFRFRRFIREKKQAAAP